MAETSNDLQKCRNLHVKREIKQLYFPFVYEKKKKVPMLPWLSLRAIRGTALSKVP